MALRALAWRAAASATVFAVALVGILAAAIGPIYLHAVDETVLAERLADAPQSQLDIHISRQTVPGAPGVDWHGGIQRLASQAADPRWFAAPVFSENAQVIYRGRARYATYLAAIDDVCAHVSVMEGRCIATSSPTETMISARTARGQHLAVGNVIHPEPAAGSLPITLRVVGIITPVAPYGPYWQPWDYFDARPTINDTQLPRLDSFFVSHAALFGRLDGLEQTVATNVRLRSESVRVRDVPALGEHVREIGALAGQASLHDSLSKTVAGSQLLAVVDGLRKEMSLARTLIVLPSAQLVLLAIFVLYAVVAGTAAALGPEVALAKLRGRRPASVLLQGVVQPVVLILVATPIAAFLAWLAVRLFAHHLLGRSVPVAFPLTAVAVVAVAAAGAVVAALVAARRIVRSPVSALLRRGTDTAATSIGLALADTAAVTLALAGLVELIAGGVLDADHADPLSALAPTLLAIAVAIVVLRLLPVAGRLVVRGTRDSPRIAAFLAVRQIVRRPAGARVLVPVGVALALAVFAATNWSVARTNRQLRALNQAGAATVLRVVPDGDVSDLRDAVDRADPGGHSMAAAYVRADRATPLLAVDTARFAGVAAWRANYSRTSLDDVLRALRPVHRPPLLVTGSRLRLDVDLTRSPQHRPVTLVVALTGANHVRIPNAVGPMHRGRSSYLIDLPPACRTGCRLTALRVEPTGSLTAPGVIDATVAAHVLDGGSWRPVDGFAQPNRWRPDGTGPAQLRDTGSGLRLSVRQAAPGTPWPQLLSAELPAYLPGVVASETAAENVGPAIHDLIVSGLDQGALHIDGVVSATTLPQLDRLGIMIDYGAALRAMTSGPAGTEFQVWLDPDAPADMPTRLARQGVRVIDTVRAATYRTALDRSGPAFADALFLVAALVAVLLALGAALLGSITTARRRAYELAAMEAAGIPRGALLGSLAVEQGVLLGAGLLVGLAAGVGGALLALPSTPFFVDETTGPPTYDGLPLGLLGAIAGGLAAALAVTCLLVAWLVSRQATSSRIREAQQ
jgi:putative ABC transport system permease protein